MARTGRAREDWAALLALDLAPSSERPIFQQIYLALREAIVGRRIAAGSRLLSTRALAERLGVSRTSVLAAYEQLIAEGYAGGRAGAGTFVAEGAAPEPLATPRRERSPSPPRPLSRAGTRYEAATARLARVEPVPFATGCCSLDATTIEAWRRAARRQLAALTPGPLGYRDAAGDRALREEVAKYLRIARAVRCEPGQVIITSGAQQAIDLAIRVLLDPGDAVLFEDPGYTATREALASFGARLVPVPVDQDGLSVEAARRLAPEARAAFITPSHQFPTGAVMSLQRRLDLLAWAAARGAWIVEDDYDSEFRYVGRPLASLQGLDRDGVVIYVGTLGKVLFPGLRLGFAVVPQALAAAFTTARLLTDRFPASPAQETVTAFMREGALASHIGRMRLLYREARDVLAEAVRRELGSLVELEVPECGIQLTLRFTGTLSDLAVAREAAALGVVVRPLSPNYIAAPARQGLVLGFSGFTPDALREAAARLGATVRRVARGTGLPRARKVVVP